VVAASQNLRDLAIAASVGVHQALCRALPVEGFDYVVFHCPPALGHVVIAALAAADEALVPVAAHAMELEDDFGPWVGWLLPFNAPLLLIAADAGDADEAVVQLERIGFDEIRGIFRDLDAWRAEDRPLGSYRVADLDEFMNEFARTGPGQLLDVRSRGEWDAGHVPGSVLRYLPDIAASTPPDELSKAKPVLVACATVHRASMAASMLAADGYEPVVLSGAGVPDVEERLDE
jgi:hydroxyacylglutathione hydrolase